MDTAEIFCTTLIGDESLAGNAASEISAQQREVLRLVDGKRCVAQIARASALGIGAYSVLSQLSDMRLILSKSASQSARKSPANDRFRAAD